MKRFSYYLVSLLILCLFLSPMAWSQEGKDPAIIIDKARIVIEEMKQSPDWETAGDLIKSSAGIAIIPAMVKGGFIIGGAYGQGVVLAYRDGVWSPPAFIYLTAGSIGLQIGAQAVDLIMVVIGQDTMKSFLRSKVKLGIDIAAAAGPVGGRASAATDITLKGGIYSYSYSKGLFAGASFEGAGIGSLPELNKKFYKKTDNPWDILYGDVSPPPSAQRLIAVLESYK
jgi:lipid-binding SYLF domain-containing protein